MSIRKALAAVGVLVILAAIGLAIDVWRGMATCTIYGSEEQLGECIATHYPICSDTEALSRFLHFKGFQGSPYENEPNSVIYRRHGFIKQAIVIVESREGIIEQISGPRFSTEECGVVAR